MKLTGITRYPIKGLAGRSDNRVSVRPHRTLEGDREYALQHIDRIPPSAEGWRPKKFFLQSVQTNHLAAIDTQWDTDQLTVSLNGESLRIIWPEECPALATWIAERVPETDGLSCVSCPTGFTDEPTPYVSLINEATVEAIAKATQTQAAPERYRGNLLISGAKPFAEHDWVGQTLVIGEVAFKVEEPIVRCRATECDWHGHRDLGFVETLRRTFDTDCCGLFLTAQSEGSIAIGDAIRVR